MTDAFPVATWPLLCDECLTDLCQQVQARPDLRAVTIFCPHNHCLTLAHAGECDGRRGILRWDTQGPLTRSEAAAAVQRLAEELVDLAPMLH